MGRMSRAGRAGGNERRHSPWRDCGGRKGARPGGCGPEPAGARVSTAAGAGRGGAGAAPRVAAPAGEGAGLGPEREWMGGKFPLSVGKSLFTLWVTERWSRLSGEGVESSPSLEILKNCLDTILCHLG